MKTIYTHTKEGGNVMLLLMKTFSHEHTGDNYEGFPESIWPF